MQFSLNVGLFVIGRFFGFLYLIHVFLYISFVPVPSFMELSRLREDYCLTTLEIIYNKTYRFLIRDPAITELTIKTFLRYPALSPNYNKIRKTARTRPKLDVHLVLLVAALRGMFLELAERNDAGTINAK